MQAVLVTNQIFAGSLGADALAAAAIGFTVSCPTPKSYYAAVLLADIHFVCVNKQVASADVLYSLQLFNLCWYFLLGVGSALDTCKGPTERCT